MGSVKSKTRYKVLSSFIAFAPMLWWGVLYMILRHLYVIRTGGAMPAIQAEAIIKRLKTFSLPDLFSVWLFAQLLWAGRPSLPDIKNFFSGLFSVSGIVLLSAVGGLIYFIRHFT